MNIIEKLRKPLLSLAVFFTVAICMTVFLPYNTVQPEAKKTITEADIQAIKDNIKKNEDKISDYEAKIESIKGDLEKALELKEQYDQQMSYIQDNIDSTDILIEQYELKISEKAEQIAQDQARVEKEYESFLERLRLSYEDGQKNFLELLVSSDDLLGFLKRAENLNAVLTYEQELIKDLEAQISSLGDLKNSLNEEKAALLELGSSQDKSRAELQKKLDESIDLIKALEKDEAALNKAIEKSNNKDAALEQELKELIKKYEEQQKEAAKGALLWPLDPNYIKCSSPYGWRYIFGKNSFHYGADFPAKKNSNIYASNDGVVLKATYGSTYGYYVLIDHGGGISTLYAHATKLLVKAGQKVKRGEVIAKVGTTGLSTGNHLHYEVRISGARKDPLVKGRLVILHEGKYVDPVEKKLIKYTE